MDLLAGNAMAVGQIFTFQNKKTVINLILQEYSDLQKYEYVMEARILTQNLY